MASTPGVDQNTKGGYKRTHLGELQGHSATKRARTEEAETLSIPQLIASLNESLLADLAKEDKIARLAETIQLHWRIIAFSNPFDVFELREIAERCLFLAPANTVFKALKFSAAPVPLPDEILEMIFKRISAPLEDFIYSTDTYKGLLSGAGLVSKAWRSVILSHFGRALGEVGNCFGRYKVTNLSSWEDLIKIAKICGGGIRSLNVTHPRFEQTDSRSADLTRLLNEFPNLKCITTRRLPDLESLASVPHTTNITQLDLSYAREVNAPEEDSSGGFDENLYIPPQRIMTLATWFQGLQYLDLSNTGLDEERLEVLLDNAVFNIRHLDISSNGKLTGMALAQHSDKLGQLEVLHLDGDNSELMNLADADLPSLRTLTIFIEEIDRLVNLFAQSRWRFTLLNLHLHVQAWFSHEPIIALLEALSCLRFLDLSGTKEVKNRRFLEASQQVPSLEVINLGPRQPGFLAGLLISPICSNLHTLLVEINSPLSNFEIKSFKETSITLKILGKLSFFDPEVMRRWCHTRAVRHLSELTLKELDPSQAEVLREAPFLQTLEVLKISSSPGINQAFLQLARYGKLPNLVSLDFDDETDITPSTAVAIAESPSFPSLTQLNYSQLSGTWDERSEAMKSIDAALEIKKNRNK